MRRIYRVRLVDLFRGKLSYRELWNLIQYLPQESWTQTILRDDPERQALVAPGQADEKFGPWSLDNFQLAALTDAVNSVRFLLARVNGNPNYPAPDPTPRPGLAATAGARPTSEPAEYVQAKVLYLDRIRARG